MLSVYRFRFLLKRIPVTHKPNIATLDGSETALTFALATLIVSPDAVSVKSNTGPLSKFVPKAFATVMPAKVHSLSGAMTPV